MKGVMTKVFRDKGFGFVRGEDGVSRFVHAKKVQIGMFDTLSEGTEIEFNHDDHPRGPRAIDVKPILNGNKR